MNIISISSFTGSILMQGAVRVWLCVLCGAFSSGTFAADIKTKEPIAAQAQAAKPISPNTPEISKPTSPAAPTAAKPAAASPKVRSNPDHALALKTN